MLSQTFRNFNHSWSFAFIYVSKFVSKNISSYLLKHHVLVHGIGVKLVSNWEQKICKVGSHVTEMWRYWNAKMKYTNQQSSKNRWENWVICLVVMFTSEIMVIRMSKVPPHLLYFLLMIAKCHSQFGQNI